MTTPPPVPFGTLLRRYRTAAGLSQEDLAERAGLSVDAVSAHERGRCRPYRDTVQRLAEALALPPHDRRAFEAAARGMGVLASRPADAASGAGQDAHRAAWADRSLPALLHTDATVHHPLSPGSALIVGVHGLAEETLRLQEYSPVFDAARFAAHERFFVEDVGR
jgi:transcriptional regulator with XRE-family HTH domain